MSKLTEVITRKGVYENVDSEARVRIDPELRDGNGAVLVPDQVNPGTPFVVASINDDGTFDVQNLSSVAQDCVWEATYNHSVQHDPLATVQTGLGTNGQDPSPEAAIPIGGGGGGGTDIRPNRLTVGNTISGDSADTCSNLDPGDGTVLKATIEGASAGDDVFVKEGTYTITNSGLLPIVIPPGVRVVGAGKEQTNIVAGPAVTRREVFEMGIASTIKSLYVDHQASGVSPGTGTSIIQMANSAVIDDVRVTVADYAVGMSLTSLISSAAQSINLQLKGVRLDFTATNSGTNVAGFDCESFAESNVEITCEEGFDGIAIRNTGTDDNEANKVSINGDAKLVGTIACDRSIIDIGMITAVTPEDLSTDVLTLTQMQGSDLRLALRGSSATASENGTGLTIEATCQDNKISGAILNYATAMVCAGQRNSFQCILESEDNISIFPEGAVGNKLVGCDIVNTGSPAVQVAGPQTVISGSRVDNGGGAVGVNLQATANNSNVTGNYINSVDQVADASAGSVEANNS